MPATFDLAEMIFKTFFIFQHLIIQYFGEIVYPQILFIYLKQMNEMPIWKRFATLTEQRMFSLFCLCHKMSS